MPLTKILLSRLSTKPSTLSLSLVLCASLLSGCSALSPYKAPLTQGNVMKQELVDGLQSGLSKGQIRILLGPPLAQHPFKPNHWEYVFYSNNAQQHAESAKQLVIQFDEDNLLDTWAMRETKPIIEERSFWSTLF